MTGDPVTDCGVPLLLPPTSSMEGLVVYCNSCDGGLAILLAGGGGSFGGHFQIRKCYLRRVISIIFIKVIQGNTEPEY